MIERKTPDELEREMDEAQSVFEEIDDQCAEARGDYELLVDQQKTILADLMAAQPEGSVAQRETMAKTQEAYKTHIKGKSEALKRWLKLNYERDRADKKLEVARSKLSYRKSEIQI